MTMILRKRILSWCIAALAGLLLTGATTVVVVVQPAAAVASWLGSFDFEETGKPSALTEVANANIDYDYATSYLTSKSMRLPDPAGETANIVKFDVSNLSDVYVAFTFVCTDTPASSATAPVSFIGATNAYLGRLETDSGVNFSAISRGGTESSSALDGVTNTKYYIKLRYEKGSGSNARTTVWASAAVGDGWGTPQVSDNGTETEAVDYVQFRNIDSWDAGYEFDWIKISSTDIAIGDVEE